MTLLSYVQQNEFVSGNHFLFYMERIDGKIQCGSFGILHCTWGMFCLNLHAIFCKYFKYHLVVVVWRLEHGIHLLRIQMK